MDKTVKILIVVCVILIAGVSVTIGMLVGQNSANNQVIVQNNTTTPANNSDSAPNNAATGPKLIDSGSTSGNNNYYSNGPFTYSWETYQVDNYNLVIYATFTTSSNTVKQNGTLNYQGTRAGTVIKTVEPKASGKSSYGSETTNYGYNTILDYYWGWFRPEVLMKGPMA